MLLDEWQAVPGVLGAVARSVDADPRAGRFLLTGSVRADIDVLLGGRSGHAIFTVDGLTFMDSSGIALFVQIHNRLGSIELRDPSDTVRRVLDITGLTQIFGVTS